MIRVGIDVGGTNTDAVLLDGEKVCHAIKSATTSNVSQGILASLHRLIDESGYDPSRINAVMLGTTHFTNAVVERRGLSKVAAVRIGHPAAATLEPFVDWPDDLRDIAAGPVYTVRGGHEVDGRPIVPFDRHRMKEVAKSIRDSGVSAAGVCSVFSPLNPVDELEAAEILASIAPEVSVTLSHQLGRIGLLARENVTLLNASLVGLAQKMTESFVGTLNEAGIHAPLYITVNDGTVSIADQAARFPVQCFASGPTNSLRGAAFLSGLQDAIVVDVGGTTTDVGCLRNGFPREANNNVEVGGVRTAFRMPDLLSIGLGGGTLVDPDDPGRIGPVSVGHRLTEQALVFGGATLTCTDVAVAAGLIELGDTQGVKHLDGGFVAAALARVRTMVSEAVDRMKTSASDTPLIAVGGGSFLIPESIEGISAVERVPYQGVANAVGAAIAQVSGEVDQIFQGMGRDAALSRAREMATERAISSGADDRSLVLVEQEDIPLAYLPGDSLRIRTRVVGDIRDAT